MDAESFKKLDKEERAKYLHEAAVALNVEDQGGDDSADAADLVKMKRDPEFYPEPHTCLVHPDEVDNYQLGGWVHAE